MTKLSELKRICDEATKHWDTSYSVSESDKEFFPLKMKKMIEMLERAYVLTGIREAAYPGFVGDAEWLKDYEREFGE